MEMPIKRREFLKLTAAGGALCLGGPQFWAFGANPERSKLISPGCRGTKVKVARLYLGTSHGLWPKPNLDFKKEIQFYESAFAKLGKELSDIEFSVDELVTSPEKVKELASRLNAVEGILAIHFNIGISPMLREILSLGKPTMVFALPYSGHEWVGFGNLRQQPLGAKMDCILSSDLEQLAVAIRPFRAIHHLREARVLNLTTRSFDEYAKAIKDKFGTEIEQISLQEVVDAYNSVKDSEAKAETDHWIKGAEQVVEPSKDDVFKSCKLALAFERLLDRENATVMTADCYGTMWDKTIMLPAYPCVGFSRLNNMGLGGICESDLRSALTHILFQGLAGKPGFISDPTVDESKGSIILAHCMGTPKMNGPDRPAEPYKLRTVMERQEGVVPQVKMRLGQKVTQAILVGPDVLRYFTGEIVDTPVHLRDDRGCRTKITVKVDGDIQRLWKNWSAGLHRQTCYGDITRELSYFCRFKEIDMIDEAA
ncbi:MAG: twin-arginine translocation signal domain-containing protein [Candidatus Aminicenantes bacterium]|nr:twin-arginine translocation signal domain-containing protein [Candidatus Aminicenantes bacterium]